MRLQGWIERDRGGDSDTCEWGSLMASEESTQSGETNAVAFGPDIVFNPQGAETCEFWAEISATDDSGVSVDKLKEGDELRIIEISGACSFAKGKSGLILSIIAAAAAVTLGGASSAAWNTMVSSMRKDLDKHMAADAGTDDNDGGKKRDGYGQEVGGGGNYAQNEGGIIVCLPLARGVVYSSDEVRRDKDGGGNNAQSGWFFPTRSDAGETRTIGQEGVLRIAAFDSNYSDNAGSYEIKFSITRPQNP